MDTFDLNQPLQLKFPLTFNERKKRAHIHAYHCRNEKCKLLACQSIRPYFQHALAGNCRLKNENCPSCSFLKMHLHSHAIFCNEINCQMVYSFIIKKEMRSTMFMKESSASAFKYGFSENMSYKLREIEWHEKRLFELERSMAFTLRNMKRALDKGKLYLDSVKDNVQNLYYLRSSYVHENDDEKSTDTEESDDTKDISHENSNQNSPGNENFNFNENVSEKYSIVEKFSEIVNICDDKKKENSSEKQIFDRKMTLIDNLSENDEFEQKLSEKFKSSTESEITLDDFQLEDESKEVEQIFLSKAKLHAKINRANFEWKVKTFLEDSSKRFQKNETENFFKPIEDEFLLQGQYLLTESDEKTIYRKTPYSFKKNRKMESFVNRLKKSSKNKKQKIFNSLKRNKKVVDDVSACSSKDT